jgi:hypothetical protein
MNLNDSIGVLIPDVADIESVGNIAIRQLLNLTSGLNDYVQADLRRLESSVINITPVNFVFAVGTMAGIIYIFVLKRIFE